MSKFTITEEERRRILNLHETRSKNHYLKEDTGCPCPDGTTQEMCCSKSEKGVEAAVNKNDMTVGDKRTVEIEPANAYGEYQDFMLQEVPLENLPSDVEVGAMLQAETQMGLINFVVKEIKESTAILDANHPLAGQKLIFDLEVLEVE